MRINGWNVNADYLIGRCFTWQLPDDKGFLEVTFVSHKVSEGDWRWNAGTELLSMHTSDGQKDWVALNHVCELIKGKLMIESATTAPFTV